jgi:hypothetical protein
VAGSKARTKAWCSKVWRNFEPSARPQLPIIISELEKTREDDVQMRLMEALGEMGGLAKPAVPIIRNVLDPALRGAHWVAIPAPVRPIANSNAPTQRPTLRDISTEALGKIDPDAIRKPPDHLFDEPQQLKW